MAVLDELSPDNASVRAKLDAFIETRDRGATPR